MLMICTILVTMGLTFAAKSSDDLPLVASVGTELKKFDIDHDEVVKKKEFLLAFWNGYDANKDGKVTQDEYEKKTDFPEFVAELNFKYMDDDNNDALKESELERVFYNADKNAKE